MNAVQYSAEVSAKYRYVGVGISSWYTRTGQERAGPGVRGCLGRIEGSFEAAAMSKWLEVMEWEQKQEDGAVYAQKIADLEAAARLNLLDSDTLRKQITELEKKRKALEGEEKPAEETASRRKRSDCSLCLQHHRFARARLALDLPQHPPGAGLQRPSRVEDAVNSPRLRRVPELGVALHRRPEACPAGPRPRSTPRHAITPITDLGLSRRFRAWQSLLRTFYEAWAPPHTRNIYI